MPILDMQRVPKDIENLLLRTLSRNTLFVELLEESYADFYNSCGGFVTYISRYAQAMNSFNEALKALKSRAQGKHPSEDYEVNGEFYSPEELIALLFELLPQISEASKLARQENFLNELEIEINFNKFIKTFYTTLVFAHGEERARPTWSTNTHSEANVAPAINSTSVPNSSSRRDAHRRIFTSPSNQPQEAASQQSEAISNSSRISASPVHSSSAAITSGLGTQPINLPSQPVTPAPEVPVARTNRQWRILTSDIQYPQFLNAAQTGNVESLERQYRLATTPAQKTEMLEDNGYRPFIEAASNGQVEVMKSLYLKANDQQRAEMLVGVEVGVNCGALRLAVANGHIKAAEWLLEQANDVQKHEMIEKSMRAWNRAILNGHERISSWFNDRLGIDNQPEIRDQMIENMGIVLFSKAGMMEEYQGLNDSQRNNVLYHLKALLFKDTRELQNVSLIHQLYTSSNTALLKDVNFDLTTKAGPQNIIAHFNQQEIARQDLADTQHSLRNRR